MSILRPKPRKFSEEDMARFGEQSTKQTRENITPKTVDPEKFQMFEVPVQGKKLVYVPNFFDEIEDEEDGGVKKVLRTDRGAYHATRYRSSFPKYRCTSGISGIEGFDGSCPLCNTSPDNWDLYNLLYKDVADSKGLDLDSKEAVEALAEDRKKLLSEMAVKGKNIELTFPVIDIELEPGTLNPVVDPKTNSLKGQVMWYHIAESTFEDKWMSAVQVFDASEQTPAGKWFILDFTYDAKNNKPTKMQSARALKVIHKPMGDKIAPFEEYFNQLAKEWTPSKARETIFANMPYDVESLQVLADEIMTSTRDKILIYKQAQGVSDVPSITTSNTSSPESIAASFGAAPAPTGEEDLVTQ